MTEISYPFSADSATGGTKLVSQIDWQQMSRLWGGDRVDFRLTGTTLDGPNLPFNAIVVNGRTVVVGNGKAWVGGFYYTLSGTESLDIPVNQSAYTRKDMIVLRADMSKSSVNIALLQGTPAATPQEPTMRRQPGGIWEMPLYAVTSVGNSAPTIEARMPYDMPAPVQFPWNAEQDTAHVPKGGFTYDADSNNTDGQAEAFNGRDGYIVSRHLGKSLKYTPNIFNGKFTIPAASRIGRWRVIAPNLAWFSVKITNPGTAALQVSGSNWYLGCTLPRAAYTGSGQTFSGLLANPKVSAGMPDSMGVLAHAANGANLTLYTPNWTGDAADYNGLSQIPAGATLYLSGVYEMNDFGE